MDSVQGAPRSRAEFCCLLLFPAFWLSSLGAQPLALLQGPAAGFIYDREARSIRPILGFPGGAHLGGSIYSGLDYASIAPNGQLALGVDQGRLQLIRGLVGGQPTASPIDGAIVNPERVLWAADSSAAVLCAAGRFQRLTGLLQSPMVEDPIELPLARWKGRVTTVAADASARVIVAGVRGRTGGAVFFISESGGVSLLASMEEPSAAAFSTDGQDLYVADRSAAHIWAFRNVGPGAGGALVLDASAGISDPVGIALSANELFVVSGAQATVRAYDLPAFAIAEEYQLDSQPGGLDPIPGSPYYRLSASPEIGSEIWLLNTQSRPSVFFVPIGQ
jgi:hypothetical protein